MFGFISARKKILFREQWGTDPRELPAAYMTRDRLKYIRMYHDTCGGRGIDEITWSDLEMDEVFFRINRTRSFAGEQVLYQRLHTPDTPDGLAAFEKMVSAFSRDEACRLEYEYRLAGLGKAQEDYYFPAMLEIIAGHRGGDIRLYRCLQLLLAAAIIGTLLTQAAVCGICAIVIACINLVVYISRRSKHEGMFSSLKTLCLILRFCRFAQSRWPLAEEALPVQVREDLDLLKHVERSAGSFADRKKAASGDPRNLLVDYLWGVTLIDLVIYEKIVTALAGSEDAALRLYHFAGMVDAAISCASFRASLPVWCVPELRHEETLSFRGMYHPLLREAVRNNCRLGRHTIITGANASGKSTFMKGFAVNVILGQTIHTCTAEMFAVPAMDVMSSMAIRDNILLGESYYVREVRYMKRMLRRLEDDRPVLFIIDEIMKGTNQKEGLAVSESILRYLKKRNCFVIAATHDYELVEKLGSEYERYYFDCRYEDGVINFDYLIRQGVGGETNAVRLLKQFDFPEEILIGTKQILEEGAAL